MKWRDNPDASVRDEEAVADLLIELRQLIAHWRYVAENAIITIPDLSSAADDLEEILGAEE